MIQILADAVMTPNPARRVLGFLCVAASLVCWLGCAGCWLAAISTKPPELSRTDPGFWSRLPPEGKRMRNRGLVFFLGVLLFGAGTMIAFYA